MPIEQSRDPKQFSAFELSGWDSNIGGYDAAFGAVARQTVRSMLDAARVTPGMQVLDVCSGPGMLAAGALQRGAEAIGLDFSVEAVELARQARANGPFNKAMQRRCRSRRQALTRCYAAMASRTQRLGRIRRRIHLGL